MAMVSLENHSGEDPFSYERNGSSPENRFLNITGPVRMVGLIGLPEKSPSMRERRWWSMSLLFTMGFNVNMRVRYAVMPFQMFFHFLRNLVTLFNIQVWIDFNGHFH